MLRSIFKGNNYFENKQKNIVHIFYSLGFTFRDELSLGIEPESFTAFGSGPLNVRGWKADGGGVGVGGAFPGGGVGVGAGLGLGCCSLSVIKWIP